MHMLCGGSDDLEEKHTLHISKSANFMFKLLFYPIQLLQVLIICSP